LLINRNIQAQPQLVRTDDALQEFPPFDGSLITKNPPPFTPVPSPSNKLFFRRLAALRRQRLPGFTVIEWSVRGRLWNAARGHYRNHSREDRHSGRDQWIETRREDRNQSERAQQWNENTGDCDHKLFQNLTLNLSAAPLPTSPRPIGQKIGQQVVKQSSSNPAPMLTCHASSKPHRHGLGQKIPQSIPAMSARSPNPAAIHASTYAAGGMHAANARATRPRIAAIVMITRRPKHPQPPPPPPPLSSSSSSFPGQAGTSTVEIETDDGEQFGCVEGSGT
jgi:hypothetical protein